MTNLNFNEFCDKYSPIKNTLEKDTPVDGFLFLDKDQLRDIPLERIWSLIDDTVNADMYNKAADRNVAREKMQMEFKIAKTNKNKYDSKTKK